MHVKTHVLFLAVAVATVSHPPQGYAQQIYWAGGGRIWRARADGTNIQAAVAPTFGAPMSVAIAPLAEKVYWTATGGAMILRADLDGANQEVLRSSKPRVTASSITIDESGSYMYWIEIRSAPMRSSTIMRADLDGSREKHILTIPVVARPFWLSNVAVDPSRNEVYWLQKELHESNQWRIRRAGLNGHAIEDVVVSETEEIGGFVWDSYGGDLYWTMDRKVLRSGLDGSVTEVLTSGTLFNFGITIDRESETLYWRAFFRSACTGWIERSDLNGQSRERLIYTGCPRNADVVLDGLGHVYWISDRMIKRAELDGTQEEEVVSPELLSPQGIAIDTEHGKVYWTDRREWYGRVERDSKIQRANLDGTEIEDLVVVDTGFPRGIALDVASDKMYWADWGDGMIRRSDLDGSQIEDLVVATTAHPWGISLDTRAGKMYWTEEQSLGLNAVKRANLDGTMIEELVSESGGSIRGVALDLDERRVYWTGGRIGQQRVRRAELDGANPEDFAGEGLHFPSGLALDPVARKLYWSNTGLGMIQSASLEEPVVEDLIEHISAPFGITVDVRRTIDAELDIRPDSTTNPVNLGARGVLPVAVLTTAVADGDSIDFDAADVDPTSLTLAGAAPRMKGRSGRIGSLADIDGDGDLDLLLHFPIADLDLTIEDTEAVLLGQTFDGTPIRGSDTISVRGIQRLGAEALRRAK